MIAHKLLTGAGRATGCRAHAAGYRQPGVDVTDAGVLVKSGTAVRAFGRSQSRNSDRVPSDPEVAIIVEDCMRVYREGGHDGLIGLGGGRIDIAKSVAVYAGYHAVCPGGLVRVDQVPRPLLIAILRLW